ncbi:MAG TPA: alpha/beta fold hydrolase [Usitatibacter sp.]|nr:alpha/beta fold hydrolase [Usitatibacter sp.]
MFARFIQLTLFLELLAYVGIGAWLHQRGWSVASIALAAVGFALGVRLALVCCSTTVSWFTRSPRGRDEELDFVGSVRLVLDEWRAMLANNFFYVPWEQKAVRPDLPLERTERIPVLLVHGYLSNRGYFRVLIRSLEARGVGPIFAPNFRGAFAGIEQFAQQLHQRLEEIVRATGQPKVVLIAFSMGGLAARAYLAREGARRLAKLITIASPHHGTALAPLGLGANARQMRRESGFLEELRGQETRRDPGCPVTSIYSPHDNLVSPQATSRLAWAKNVAIPGHGHVALLLSRRLSKVVLEELREAGVAAND